MSRTLRQFPYRQASCDPPSSGQISRATDFRIDGWNVVNDDTTNQFLDNVKGELAQNKPVILSMRASDAFEHLRSGTTYRNPTSCTEGEASCGHAIVAVGYDERRQAVKLINSWGIDWADEGFGWIGYETFKTEVRRAYVMQVKPRNPATCSLAASATSINPGTKTTLIFSSDNADAGFIDNGVGNVPAEGTRTIAPSQTTTYTGRFSGRGGTTSCMVTITVKPLVKPVIASFRATPETTTKGQSATLSWSVSAATSLRIDNGVGSVSGNSVVVSPAATTAYTLKAENSAGTTTATTTVTVAREMVSAPTCGLSANPASIMQGGTAILSYNSQNATGGTIDNGIGSVAAKGTKSISPSQTTLYTGTFSGPGGTATCTAAVGVWLPQAIVLPEGVCGKIAIVDRAGKRTIAGFVGKDEDLERIRATADGAELEVQVRPFPQCEALMTLNGPLARSVTDGLKVRIRRPPGGALKSGDELLFEIETPDYQSYIHVAYIQAAGSVVNLTRLGGGLSAPRPPRTKLVFGTGAEWGRFRISPPFGREMLVVLAGRQPVFDEPRPDQETEREFLTALRRALIAKPYPSDPDPNVVANYDAIVTTGR